MSSTYTEVFVAIAATDLAPVVEFYQTVFACDPCLVQGDRYIEFQMGTLRLGLFKPSTVHESEFRPTSSSMSLCIEVEHLDFFMQRLQTSGMVISGTITTASHGREIYIYDPLGNRLILHESHRSSAGTER